MFSRRAFMGLLSVMPFGRFLVPQEPRAIIGGITMPVAVPDLPEGHELPWGTYGKNREYHPKPFCGSIELEFDRTE